MSSPESGTLREGDGSPNYVLRSTPPELTVPYLVARAIFRGGLVSARVMDSSAIPSLWHPDMTLLPHSQAVQRVILESQRCRGVCMDHSLESFADLVGDYTFQWKINMGISGLLIGWSHFI